MSHPLQAFFGKVPLFSDLTPEELNEILRGIQPMTVSRGHILFQEGDAPDAAYVVEGGDLDVYLERKGTRIPIATIGPNSILGEIALLDGQARTASVQARTDCALFRLEKREFDYLRKNLHPAAYKVARRIAMTVCERIREQIERYSHNSPGTSRRNYSLLSIPQASQSSNQGVLNRRKVFWVDWPLEDLMSAALLRSLSLFKGLTPKN